MSKVVSLMEYKEQRRGWSTTPQIAPRRSPMTEAQKLASLNYTREGLMVFLKARRERLGMTEQDVRESPERVLEKQYNTDLHRAQQKLLEEYLQTQDSVDTM